MRSRIAAAGQDRGAITLMLVALAVMLIALAGIVVDGGAKLEAAENAAALAQEAARAGAGLVSQSPAYAAGTFAVDYPQALAASRAYLAGAGARDFTVTADPPVSVRVTVTITQPTRFLAIIGISQMTSTGSATANLAAGVTGPGR